MRGGAAARVCLRHFRLVAQSAALVAFSARRGQALRPVPIVDQLECKLVVECVYRQSKAGALSVTTAVENGRSVCRFEMLRGTEPGDIHVGRHLWYPEAILVRRFHVPLQV